MIKIKTRPKLASCAWTAMLATGLWIGIVSSQRKLKIKNQTSS